MTAGLRVSLSLAAVLLIATPTWAQSGRGFVRGLGGITFGSAATASILGGGVGVNLGRNLQITGEFGRIHDVLPNEVNEMVEDVAALFTLETGVPIDLDVQLPTLYGLAGVRYNVPTDGRIQPFVEVQAGFANISFDVEAEVLGIDVSDEIEEEADIESATKFLIGLGGGIGLSLTDVLGVDIGYRYGRIFNDDPAINTNAVYGALRVRF
jgi:opacity protein-like surface antigen